MVERKHEEVKTMYKELGRETQGKELKGRQVQKQALERNGLVI